MSKPARLLTERDAIYIDAGPDSTRILCEVVRAPQRLRIPANFLTFWVVDKISGDLHMVSAPDEYIFEAQEKEGDGTLFEEKPHGS